MSKYQLKKKTRNYTPSYYSRGQEMEMFYNDPDSNDRQGNLREIYPLYRKGFIYSYSKPLFMAVHL